MTVVDRVLGLLALTMDQPNQAVSHFEDALAFCRSSGYRPELAWSCHDYAEALLIRNGSSAPERALDLLQEALIITRELGMPPLEERVLSLQQRVSQLAKPLLYPGGLTEREVEVVRLIAQGKTNRDIAEELVLSQRTVQRHIANLYRKINVHNRVEATAFALNQLAS